MHNRRAETREREVCRRLCIPKPVHARRMPVDDARGREAVDKRGQVDAAAVGFDELAANDILLLIIRSLDEHIRPDRLDQPQRASPRRRR